MSPAIAGTFPRRFPGRSGLSRVAALQGKPTALQGKPTAVLPGRSPARRAGPDIYDDWARLREVAEDGAILVRPDKHIGWRSMTLPDDPERALHAAWKGAGPETVANDERSSR
jgi:2,4-dichlorophenol 6-monooxygenase